VRHLNKQSGGQRALYRGAGSIAFIAAVRLARETKHIRWKTGLPGKGHSTPIIWGERIFLDDGDPLR
jgi:hypothetical protein